MHARVYYLYIYIYCEAGKEASSSNYQFLLVVLSVDLEAAQNEHT